MRSLTMPNDFLNQFMAGWQMGQGRNENRRRDLELQQQQEQDMYRRQQEEQDRQMRMENYKLQKQELDLRMKKEKFQAMADAAAMTSRQQEVLPPETHDLGGATLEAPNAGVLNLGALVQERTPIMAEVPGAPEVGPVQLPFREDIEAQKEAESQRKMREALGLRKTPEEIEAESYARARGERRGAPPVGPREPQGSFQEAVGPDGKPILFNSTTGEVRPYPTGVTPKLTRTQAPTGAERQALAYYNRANEALTGIEDAEDNIAKAGLFRQVQAHTGVPYLQTEEQRQYSQRQRAFTEARLRKESGAAIPPHEYENDAKTYFAVPGDKPETIERKRVARQKVVEGLAFSSGKAFDEFYGEPFKRQGEPETSTTAPPKGKYKIIEVR